MCAEHEKNEREKCQCVGDDEPESSDTPLEVAKKEELRKCF
jgi:hypothetical protein